MRYSPAMLGRVFRICALHAAPLLLIACGAFSVAPEPAEGGVDRGTVTDGGAGAACDASAPTCDSSCGAAECPVAPSCKVLHAARTDLPDGLYAIDTDGAGSRAPLQVYCDMSTAGGGWTLVARSVPGGATAGAGFGWEAASGAVNDEAKPYSLGASQVGLAFTEVLLGARGTNMQWDTPVYKHVVPADFLQTYQTTAFEPTSGPSTVLGTCNPPNGPSMLSVLGHTSLDDHFAFHDVPANPSFGLFADAWNTNGKFDSEPAKCTYSGALTGKPGMLFVR